MLNKELFYKQLGPGSTTGIKTPNRAHRRWPAGADPEGEVLSKYKKAPDFRLGLFMLS